MKKNLSQLEKEQIFNQLYNILSNGKVHVALYTTFSKMIFNYLYSNDIIFCENRFTGYNERYSKLKFRNGEKIIQVAFNVSLNNFNRVVTYMANINEEGKIQIASRCNNSLYGDGGLEKVKISKEEEDEIVSIVFFKLNELINKKKSRKKEKEYF